MIGPLLIVAVFSVVGLVTGGWPGAVAAAIVGVLLVGAVAAAAVLWAERIGKLLDPDEAFRLAPRPPLFGPMCDTIYRRVLRLPPQG
jgi:uncharacterized iron-regulated membrane protein